MKNYEKSSAAPYMILQKRRDTRTSPLPKNPDYIPGSLPSNFLVDGIPCVWIQNLHREVVGALQVSCARSGNPQPGHKKKLVR